MPKYTKVKNERKVLTSPVDIDSSDTALLLGNAMPIDGHHEEAEDTGMESDNPFYVNAERVDARITEEGYVYSDTASNTKWYTRVYNAMIDWFKSIGGRKYDFNNPLSDTFSEEKGAIDIDVNITGFGNPLYVFPQEKLDLQDAKISDKSELTNKEDRASNKPWYKRAYSAMIDWAQSARKGIVSGMVGLLQSIRHKIDKMIAKIERLDNVDNVEVDTDVKKSAYSIDIDIEDFSLTKPKSLLVQEEEREMAAVNTTLNPSLPPYPLAYAYEEIAPSGHEVLEVPTRIASPQHQKVQQSQNIEQDLITF
ncbi:hypothetical protein [Wolbachia endosymbiont of Folsomia candida]|uniref:hypothetical protein n=1 Tax=Wolbachia endosymbiont of Folsomia candida TaxID=169402 RepID=UPI000A6AB307|nr:hypothetical protein [Wolbachia endosymbiont of Folsomia candida]APR98838.1 hypothetical protein ASM33_06460 [Wolbachia endosymbiont of Folsomia candida]